MLNNYFTLCETPDGNLEDKYDCCYNTCMSNMSSEEKMQKSWLSKVDSICIASCNKLYPDDLGFIPTSCIVENECWDNFVLKNCLVKKKKKIHTCCVQKCVKSGHYNIDCERFCNQYKIAGVL